MFNNNTDMEWKAIGKSDPYFGVLTENKYLSSNITDTTKIDFFQTGYDHLAHILEVVKEKIDPNFSIKRALDFGCGVGRIVIPLSEIAESVTGVDISNSMLDEARKNCDAKSIKNVELFLSDDDLSLVNGQFNFIHSFIVFQHIPEKRGRKIFINLLNHLDEGGVGVIHFQYEKDYHLKKIIPWIKKYVPFSKYVINLIKGKNIFTPQMQMNSYNLNKIFMILQKQAIHDIHLEFTNSVGEYGIVIFFKK